MTDGSGASNYDNIPLVNWPVQGFRSHSEVCFQLTAEEIDGEDDPQWLMANGFDPIGTMQFAQYFLASDDYNDEIVVSLMLHVNSARMKK